MSASEMLTFFRYAPLMFGRFVKENNVYWQLLLKLKRIVSLLYSKHFNTNWIDYLNNLIFEHHEQFIALFGPMKPKFHFLTHSGPIIKKMDPLNHFQGIRGEAKHRDGKLVSNAVSTRVNICKTIAIKQQLMLSNQFLLNKGFNSGLSTGLLKRLSNKTVNLLTNLMPNRNPKDYSLSDFVTVYNTKYRTNYFVIIDKNEDDIELPSFVNGKMYAVTVSEV